jgi:hypothetical protein
MRTQVEGIKRAQQLLADHKRQQEIERRKIVEQIHDQAHGASRQKYFTSMAAVKTEKMKRMAS